MILTDSIAGASESVARLFEELYDPAFLIDPERGRFVGANDAACAFLDYSSSDFRTLTPEDIHPHEIPRLEAFVSQVRRHGRWVAEDLSCRARSGQLLPAQLRASLVQLNGEEYILAIVRDRREEELAELGRSLRRLTHDLRNTMVASRLMSDRLARHEDPLVRRSAAVIARSVDRAVAMCEQTLTVGRASERHPARECFDLEEVMSELSAAVGEREQAAALLDTAAAAGVLVEADFDQLYRVLLNLVRNAVGAGAATVRIEAGVSSDGAVHIDVADDGPGLPDEVQAYLFAEKPMERAGNGAGLGLAIAWELTRNHGGELRLVETGPTGTRFRIALPAIASGEPTARHAQGG